MPTNPGQTPGSSIVFADSFDHYSAGQLFTKWTQGAFLTFPVAGRNGNGLEIDNGAFVPGGISVVIPGYGQAFTTVGFAYKFHGLAISPSEIFSASASATGTKAISLQIGPDSCLSIWGGNNLLGYTVDTPMYENVWYYIEINFEVVWNKAGNPAFVQGILAINGKTLNMTQISTTGPTTPANTPVLDTFGFTKPSNAIGSALLDDVYIAAAATIDPSTFLGDVKVIDYYPVSDNAGNQWTGDHTLIDNNPPNPALGALSAITTVGLQSYFGFQQITGYASDPAIPGVYSLLFIVGDTGSEIVWPMIGDSGSPGDGVGTPGGAILLANTVGYQFLGVGESINPLANTPWTKSNFNVAFPGVRLAHN